MTDPDRRSFSQRNPALLAAIVLVAALTMGSLFMIVRLNVRASLLTGQPPAWQINAWATLALVSFLTLAVLLKLAWRRRLGPPPDYLCGRCGYDRRGVPDLSPCPECGAPTTGE